MENKLGYIQKQEKTLSNKMIPSIKILEMGLFDLNLYVKNILDSNPVFEMIGDPAFNDELYKNKAPIDSNNFDVPSEDENTLFKYIYKQVLDYINNENDEKIVTFILYSLDRNGFFKEDIVESAKILGVDKKRFIYFLDIIKNCEPKGVGSFDLRECLLKQIDEKREITRTIVNKFLEEIATRNYKLIADYLDVDENIVREEVEYIKGLNPRPANGFAAQEKTIYIIPDVYIEKDNNEITVKLNSSYIPKYSIVEEIDEIYRNKQNFEARDFLKTKYKEFHNLKYYIDHRNKTLYNVSISLVKIQNDYFRTGDIKRIKPLKLADISNMLGIAISTVSRAFNNKYLSCEYGIFPFSFFLNKEVSEGVSEFYLKERLKELIYSDPKLSDGRLLIRLKKEGITVSRRTINNYRNKI